ncbi:EpsG family protein [Enterococcus faecium]|nr:EpsG family protein [Enterococcus faecium]
MIIFICLTLFSLWELMLANVSKWLFYVMYAVLSGLAILRFGIGTDYFSYKYIYEIMPKITEFNGTNLQQIHGEIGFKISIGVSKSLGLSSEVYIAVITGISLLFLLRFFNIYIKEYKMIALLIFYSMYYFTYINSGIRQGLTICVFLGVGLLLWEKKKYLYYYMLIIMLATFHSSVLIVVFLPFINFLKKEWILLFITIISLGNFLISVVLKTNLLLSLLPITPYTDVLSLPAFSIRALSLILIIILYFLTKNNNARFDNIFYSYLIVFYIYIAFASNSLIASRLHVYFKALEMILVPGYLGLLRLNTRRVLGYIILLTLYPIFWSKEINSQLSDGSYYNRDSLLNYKYVSVFNQNDIYQLRHTKYDFTDL